MEIKVLLEVEIDEDLVDVQKCSKRQLAEIVVDRLMLNELGRVDAYVVKIVNDRLVKYGDPL